MLSEPGKYWLIFSCDHTLVVSMWSKCFGSKLISSAFMFSAFTNLETGEWGKFWLSGGQWDNLCLSYKYCWWINNLVSFNWKLPPKNHTSQVWGQNWRKWSLNILLLIIYSFTWWIWHWKGPKISSDHNCVCCHLNKANSDNYFFLLM